MYIGLIIYGSLQTISGGYLYDRQLVAHLRALGDQVEVISLPWSSYGRHLAHNLSPRLYKRLREAPFDLLLQDELNHPSLFWLNQRLRREVAYPLISIVHHLRSSEARPAWQNRFYRSIEQRYLASVDGFIFNSHTTREVVFGLLEPEPRELVPPHVVAYPAGDRFQPNMSREMICARATQSGPLRLLFVGNVTERKGLYVLLSALALLSPADWRLDVVGNLSVEPSYSKIIKDVIEKEGLSQQLILHGALSDSALRQRFADSHLLVVPSSYEGFGIVYLEGMGFGLPAIASTAGAAHELITHGKNGFLVPHQEPIALARHLHTLIHSRQRLQQMSLAAHQHYLTHPTWHQSMTQIHRFLHHNALFD
ncbi:MAG: glycosyltransferase family 4 protein [Ardenticatenaceae bacterium]